MSTEDTIRAGQYIHWGVTRRKLSGVPVSPASFHGSGQPGPYAPISLELALAPAVARLRFGFEPEQLGMPWQWPRRIALDDMVELTGDQPSGRVGLFSGFVVEPDWSYQGSGGDCVMVAMGRAQRLLADAPVYGRWMYAADGSKFHATGLGCEFNASGLPNRDDRTTTPMFTADGDPKAVFWSATHAMRYLAERYNAEETWLSNPAFTTEQQDDTRPIFAMAEGLSLWEAMAAVANAGGYDVWEQYSWWGDVVVGAIRYQKRGAGAAYELRHQKPAVVHQPVDIKKTNSFSARVAESVASCITAPVVLGARKLTELSIWLFPIWQPFTPDYIPASDGPLILENDAETTYSKRHTVAGADFADYRFVGRRWDANTDRLYPASTYGAIIGNGLDMGLAVDGEADSWPLMAHRPLPLIARAAYGSDVVAYWTPDGGTTYYPLKGFHVQQDRLGIYITQPNLADIQYGDKKDKATQNFFAALVANYLDVQVFLRCTVASPVRSRCIAARRTTAGTQFSTSRAFDRGQAGVMLTIAPDSNSPWYAQVSGIANEDRSDELNTIAGAIQTVAEDRFIEASFELPWPESEISLGDQVQRISGIDYKLGTNSGPAARYPRVVRLVLNLTPQTYDTQICLDTDRQAGVI